jgi:porin
MPMLDRRSFRRRMAAAALAMCAAAGPARAADPAQPLTLELRETAEYWRNLQGGLSVGDTTLNKAQFIVKFDGQAVGWRGFTARAQLMKTNAESLSLVRTGDIQTVSNIEAPDVSRLFEFWVSQTFGAVGAPGFVGLRGGLMDLNNTFDSIEPAGLFLNSSHGIGPDLSRSSMTGPSIFPVTGPAIQADWRPTPKLFAHVGVFTVPDPNRTGQFADLRITGQNGLVVIGQLDYALGRDAQASFGVWRPTAAEPSLVDPTRRIEPHPAVYGFVYGPTPLPGRPAGWIRLGLADGRVQAVAAYAGGGLNWSGLVPGRKSDSFGVAVAHAVIGGPAHDAQGLPPAETTLEATYSLRLNRYLRLQPDVQHIIHPAGAPNLRNATAVGLRLVAAVHAPDPSDGGD